MARFKRALPYLALVAAVMGIAFSAPFGREAVLGGGTPIQVAVYRMAFSCLLFLPVVLLSKKGRAGLRGALRPKGSWPMILLAGACLSVHFFAWYRALEAVTVFTATVLFSLHPFFTLLGAWVFFKERPRLAALIAILMAFLGVVVLSYGGAGGGTLVGNLWTILSSLAYAAYLLCGSRARRDLNASTYCLLVFFTCGALLAILGLILGQSLIPTGQTLLWCLGIALTSTLIGHGAFNWALGYLSASVVTFALLGEPVGATFVAFIMDGTLPSPIAFLGGALILGGVGVYAYLTNLRTKRLKKGDIT